MYASKPSRCGRLTDNNFNSATMCCACGGGAAAPAAHNARQPSTDDLACYSARYPDLAAAYGQDTAALRRHWNEYGKSEGRDPYCSDDENDHHPRGN